MDFVEVVEQARALLQDKGRMTYRTLKRQFALEDEALEDLKEELIYSTPQIHDDAGCGLVWTEETEPSEPSVQPAATPTSEPPAVAVSTQPEPRTPTGELAIDGDVL